MLANWIMVLQTAWLLHWLSYNCCDSTNANLSYVLKYIYTLFASFMTTTAIFDILYTYIYIHTVFISVKHSKRREQTYQKNNGKQQHFISMFAILNGCKNLPAGKLILNDGLTNFCYELSYTYDVRYMYAYLLLLTVCKQVHMCIYVSSYPMLITKYTYK